MRPGSVFTCAAIVCAVGLSSCDKRSNMTDSHGSTSASGYCATFKTASASGAQNGAIADPSAAVDDCIHRWAYVLSRSHDPADVVAHATLEACSTALSTWSQMAANTPQLDQTSEPPRYSRRRESRSEPAPNPMAQKMGMVNAKALFYVVQARAGSCEPPAADSLVAPPIPN